MATYTFTIALPARIDKAIFWPLLLYRRLRYGYAFRKILLNRGRFAIVDQDDFEKFKEYKWHLLRVHSRSQYAGRMVKRGNKRCRETMHRVVTNAPDGLYVDHINHNGLDNRKENLRIVTPEQNAWNTRGQDNNISSQYKGVSWNKKRRKWVVSIRIDRKSKHIGFFEDEKEAAAAYDKAAKKHRGEYAFLNFGDT